MIPLPTIPTQYNQTPVLSPQEIADKQATIRQLAADNDTVILAHNYQRPEVQDVADFVGDSLQLSRQATTVSQQQILFCGVHFMAESASILSPQKTVLLPDAKAGCSLADSITVQQLQEWQAKYDNPITIMYVNTTAAVKSITDFCCTSSNAVDVVQHVMQQYPGQPILFGPDMWLGAFVQQTLNKQLGEAAPKLHIWDGECHVHAGIRPSDVQATLDMYPQADMLLHPECSCANTMMEFVVAGDLPADRVKVLSTGAMLQAVKDDPQGEFIVGTENGMMYPLQQAAPDIRLHTANRQAWCKYMKMINLENMLAALQHPDGYVVQVPQEIAQRAIVPIERMISLG